jgi:solute carrier family 34 (sodium-dependent phosphate cotransporter)
MRHYALRFKDHIAQRREAVTAPRSLRHVNLLKIAYALAGLVLFILALQLMKAGARQLAPVLENLALVQTPLQALGLGWLGAYLVLSGSPVAAAALGLFNGGAITELQTFMMINGSRMGSSFIILFVGFLYMVRGNESKRSLGIGLLTTLTTWTTYVPAMLLGSYLLSSGALTALHFSASAELASFVDTLFNPIVSWITSWAPGLFIFVIGVLVILLAFNFIDHALPELKLAGDEFGEAPSLLFRPVVMFLIGSAITAVSMSVSVSVSLLVPLSARGYIRRENVIPYIMGANITTFIDTLVASLFMNNPASFTIVLVEMLSVSIVSLLIMVFTYRFFERQILNLANRITATRRGFSLFMILLLGMPIVLLFVPRLFMTR